MSGSGMSKLDELYYRALGAAKTVREMENVFRRGRIHVGQNVMFRSGSAPGGLRAGKVVSLGPRRAVISFKWLKSGREQKKSVPYSDILERRIEAQKEKKLSEERRKARGR